MGKHIWVVGIGMDGMRRYRVFMPVEHCVMCGYRHDSPEIPDCVDLPDKMPTRMTLHDWNDLYYFHVEHVEHVEGTGGCLMIYQTMSGKCRFRGILYHVSGWAPPQGDPYVTAEEIKDGIQGPVRREGDRATRQEEGQQESPK